MEQQLHCVNTNNVLFWIPPRGAVFASQEAGHTHCSVSQEWDDREDISSCGAMRRHKAARLKAKIQRHLNKPFPLTAV